MSLHKVKIKHYTCDWTDCGLEAEYHIYHKEIDLGPFPIVSEGNYQGSFCEHHVYLEIESLTPKREPNVSAETVRKAFSSIAKKADKI